MSTPATPTELTVDLPPEAPHAAPTPLFRALLPLVMLVAVGGMVAFMVLSGRGSNPMTYLFPVLMIASMVGMATGTKPANTRAARRAYLRHLDSARRTAHAATDTHLAHLHTHHPPAQSLWTLAATSTPWGRSPGHPLFGTARLGVARLPAPTIITHPPLGGLNTDPTDLDPTCTVALRRAVQDTALADNTPIAIPLAEYPLIHLTGDATACRDTARALLCHLAFHHGPSQLAIETSDATGQWEWVQWLPHTTPTTDTIQPPLVVRVVDDPAAQPAHSTPAGTTVLHIDHTPTRPHNPWQRQANDGGLTLTCAPTHTTISTQPDITITAPDHLTHPEADLLARTLAPRPHDNDPTSAATETPLDTIELILGTPHPQLLNPDHAWQPRLGRDRLRVPIGLTSTGDPFILDIKESAEGGAGPHGLCVGATGSGKSELLRTLVLALVATHSPEQLNTLLIDFKGGATFAGFERLPHVDAVVTNLSDDATLVDRMRDALAGELTRRQEVLRAAGYSSAADYNTARLHRADLDPLPALLVIIDEFSELLTAHPDFIDLFVAIGRLGRSLGIHLLLGTQRLEEGKLRGLDAHLSYRIGLRTFSAQESRAVLGVPDAHLLPQAPGHGLADTGTGAITAFRAAYVSGALSDAESTTLLEASLEQLSVDGPHADLMPTWAAARHIWLPPLPATLPLAQLPDGQPGQLRVPIGIIDNPSQQAQEPYMVDMSGQGGHVAIVGAPRSGASMAARTLLTQLAAHNSAQRLEFYVLDVAGSACAPLAALPHTVCVVHRHQAERLSRVQAVLGQVAHDRREMFALHGWAGMDEARAHGVSDVVVLVDGWHVLTRDFPDVADMVAELIADGLALGIHVVATTNRWTAIRPMIRDLMGSRIELRLGDALDSVVDRKKAMVLPDCAGRCLVKTEGEALYGQVALTSAQVVQAVATACVRRGDRQVEQLRLLPTDIGWNHTNGIETVPNLRGEVTLGIEGNRLTPWAWNHRTHPMVLIAGNPSSGRSTAIRTLATALARTYTPQDARIVLIDPRRSLLGDLSDEILAGYASTADTAATLLGQAITTLTDRLPPETVTQTQLKNRSWWHGPDIFILIDDLDLLGLPPTQHTQLLGQLASLVPHARDIGLHLAVSRRTTGIHRALHEPLLQALTTNHCVPLILSATPSDGPVLGIPLGAAVPGRAHTHTPDGTLAVQLINTTPSE